MTEREVHRNAGTRDAMDILQQWVDAFNATAQPTIALRSAGEAGGAQLRLRYEPSPGNVSIFHMVAVVREGKPVILVNRFDGPMPDTAVRAGLWASEQLGRRTDQR
jgi:hypothetical protein